MVGCPLVWYAANVFAKNRSQKSFSVSEILTFYENLQFRFAELGVIRCAYRRGALTYQG